MCRKLIVCVCFVLVLFSGLMFAGEGGYYLGGSAGISDFKDSTVTMYGVGSGKIKYDSGALVSGFLGYDYGRLRVEGEVSYIKSDFESVSAAGESASLSGDATSLAGLANFYIDFYNESSFVSFLTAGAGFSRVEVGDILIPDLGITIQGDNDNVFCYQFGAGVGYMFNDKLILDIKYRYFATSDPKFALAKANFSSNNFIIGLRYRF